MSNKLDFVKNLTSTSDIWTVTDAMECWWQNPQGGWRLTWDGFRALKNYKLEHWKFEAPKLIISPWVLLTLDRKLTGPFFLNSGKDPHIAFFNSKEATMYALYGDVTRFIKAIGYEPDAHNRA